MAGRLTLTTTGVQDTWLTGEPQFSYFLMNFKRHSKFSFDYVECQFNGTIDFGEIITCRIPGDKGDFVKNLTLKMTLNDPGVDSEGKNDVYWARSIGSHMIEYAELLIGGQIIERITGEYIYMHQQLHNTDDDIEQTLYFLNGHGKEVLSYSGEYTYFLEMPFYFYRNPALAIPTCALTKQVIEVRIKTRPLSQLIDGGSLSGDTGSILNISLDAEFVYVTPEETAFLMSRPIDHVITQVQMSQFVMQPGETKKSVMLHFKHPVRELLFVSQSEVETFFNFSIKYNDIVSAELRFNNQVVFSRDANFLTYEQAFRYHVNTPIADLFEEGFTVPPNLFSTRSASAFGMYSFGLNPEVPYPTGQVNMSRIVHKLFTIEIRPTHPDFSNNTRVYAVNYNVLRFQSGLAGLKF